MADSFFTQTNCDRCKTSLVGKARTMSMYNKDCICMNCKEVEKKRSDYKNALSADNEQIRAGNYNFKGIGLPKEDKR